MSRPIVPSLLVGLLACTEPPGPSLPGDVRGDAAALPGITVYGLGGARRAAPRTPCAEGHYRDFDLWLGDWVVMTPVQGVPTITSTNQVVAQLDGCAVTEHWKPNGAVHGRSLNAWDAEAGVWRQTWVPEAARPFRMAGGLRDDGVMDLTGTRVSPLTGARFVDHYWWTRVDADHVRQDFTFDIDLFDVHQKGSILYTRATAPLPSFGSSGGGRCLPGGDTQVTRRLDYAAGAWRVEADNGLALGESEVVVGVAGCLFEERFTNGKGLAAIAWTYYDPIVGLWHRAMVDSEGEYVGLAGTSAPDGTLTLEGVEPVPGHPDARLRLVHARGDAGTVRQAWSISTDGGASWRETRVLRLVPR